MLATILPVLHLAAAADPNEDTLGIIVFFFDFFIFALIITALFNRFANRNAVKLWPGLAPIINGTFHKGIGLTTPYIKGNYHGMPVRAYVLVTARSRWNYEYYFQIQAGVDAHGQDWQLRNDQGIVGKLGWEIHTKDPMLQQRLAVAGLMEIIPDWDIRASLRYSGRKGTLLYSHRIFTRDGLPAPEVFQNELDLLKKVANINKQVNEQPRKAGSISD